MTNPYYSDRPTGSIAFYGCAIVVLAICGLGVASALLWVWAR